MGEEFDYGWFDEESATNPIQGSDDADELSLWKKEHRALWELGVKLATSAMYYNQESAYYPFYKSGFYSPN